MARSNLSLAGRERSTPSSLMARTRVECSLTTEPTELSMKSPPFGMLNMIDGIDR